MALGAGKLRESVERTRIRYAIGTVATGGCWQRSSLSPHSVHGLFRSGVAAIDMASPPRKNYVFQNVCLGGSSFPCKNVVY